MFNASVFLGKSWTGLGMQCKMAAEGFCKASQSQGTREHILYRAPGAALPHAFGEPGARAQMEATFHLWQYVKVVNQVNKLLTKI